MKRSKRPQKTSGRQRRENLSTTNIIGSLRAVRADLVSTVQKKRAQLNVPKYQRRRMKTESKTELPAFAYSLAIRMPASK